MDIVLNPRSWQSQAGRPQRLPAPLDWHGLAARLLAADACRRSLAAAAPSGAGSFGGGLALVPVEGEEAVNPIASGAGKADADKSDPRTGAQGAGDRGWK